MTEQKKPSVDVAKPLRQKVQALRRAVWVLAEDDDWRSFLQAQVGERSTRSMTERQLKVVIEALHRAGAPRVAAKAAGTKAFPYQMTPQVRKARALWIDGAKTGHIRNRTDAALAEFIHRVTGQEMGVLSATDASKAIDGIKVIIAREAEKVKGG